MTTSNLRFQPLLDVDLRINQSPNELQNRLFIQLRRASSILTELENTTIVLDPVERDTLESIYAKWIRFYIENYELLYHRKDRSEIDPNIKLRYALPIAELSNQRLFDNKLEQLKLDKINRKKSTSSSSTTTKQNRKNETGMMSLQFLNGMRSMLAQHGHDDPDVSEDEMEGEGETGDYLHDGDQEHRISSSITTIEREGVQQPSKNTPKKKFQSRYDILESMIVRCSGERGVPSLETLRQFTDKVDEHDSELKAQLFYEEFSLFGEYAENKLSIIMFVEMMRLRGLLYPHPTNIQDSELKSMDIYSEFGKFIRETFDVRHFDPNVYDDEYLELYEHNVHDDDDANNNNNERSSSHSRRKWNDLVDRIMYKMFKQPSTQVLPIDFIFTASHLFVYFESVFQLCQESKSKTEFELLLRRRQSTRTIPQNIWKFPKPTRITNYIGGGGIGGNNQSPTNQSTAYYSPCVVLKEYSKQMINTPLISDEIDNILISLITPPHMKECFIMREVNGENVKHLHNRPRIRMTMDENFVKSLRLFLPDLYNQLRGTDSVALQMDWFLLLSRDPRFQPTFYLMLFHYFLHENYQFTYWIERYVRHYTAFRKFPGEILKNSHDMPYFVQIQPFMYYLVWRGEVLYESMDIMLYKYIQIIETECEGILRFESAIKTKIPDVYVWNELLPYHVTDVDAIFRSSIKIQGIHDMFLERYRKYQEENERFGNIDHRTRNDGTNQDSSSSIIKSKSTRTNFARIIRDESPDTDFATMLSKIRQSLLDNQQVEQK